MFVEIGKQKRVAFFERGAYEKRLLLPEKAAVRLNVVRAGF
jgi:hypothetical protein